MQPAVRQGITSGQQQKKGNGGNRLGSSSCEPPLVMALNGCQARCSTQAWCQALRVSHRLW